MSNARFPIEKTQEVARQALSKRGGRETRNISMDVPELRIESESAVEHSSENDSPNPRRRTEAQKQARRDYINANREKIRFQQRTLQAKKRQDPEFKARQEAIRGQWRDKNREHLRKKYRETYRKNPEARYATQKKTIAKNPDKYKAYAAEYRAKHKAKAQAYMTEYVAKNKAALDQKAKEYLPRRKELNKIRRKDPTERLKDACRTRVGFILKKAGIPKFNHTFELVSCTPDFFKAHIEQQFRPGMSWQNFGEWEIDHKKALSKFDLSVREERLKAFHYSNCQPLWQPENRSKCNREEPYIKLHYVVKPPTSTLPAAHQPFLI